MKRFILFLCATFIVATQTFLTFSTAHALGDEYLRVTEKDAPFYADKNESEFLFFLPYTYYVRVLEDSGDVVHAEIVVQGATLDGYIPKSALYFDGLSVESPYPEIALTTSKDAVLYADKELSSPTLYAFKGRKMTYLGYAEHSGEVIYYVSYNSHLGYVKESDVMPFSIDNHPNPLTFIPSQEESEPLSPEKNRESGDLAFILRLIVIGALSLAGAFGLIIALVKKPKKEVSFYDENEYEV